VTIEYERRSDQAYIYLRQIGPGEAVRQVSILEYDVQLVLDLDSEERLIGIDVTAASRSLPPELLVNAPEPPPQRC
jgi:uncharacterized protein YuzE